MDKLQKLVTMDDPKRTLIICKNRKLQKRTTILKAFEKKVPF